MCNTLIEFAARQSNDRKEKPFDRVQEDFPTTFAHRPDFPPFANQRARRIWDDIRRIGQLLVGDVEFNATQNLLTKLGAKLTKTSFNK